MSRWASLFSSCMRTIRVNSPLFTQYVRASDGISSCSGLSTSSMSAQHHFQKARDVKPVTATLQCKWHVYRKHALVTASCMPMTTCAVSQHLELQKMSQSCYCRGSSSFKGGSQTPLLQDTLCTACKIGLVSNQVIVQGLHAPCHATYMTGTALALHPPSSSACCWLLLHLPPDLRSFVDASCRLLLLPVLSGRPYAASKAAPAEEHILQSSKHRFRYQTCSLGACHALQGCK